MATEAATLQNVTRSFLWHSIMLFIGAAGLYCVAPSINTAFLAPFLSVCICFRASVWASSLAL